MAGSDTKNENTLDSDVGGGGVGGEYHYYFMENDLSATKMISQTAEGPTQKVKIANKILMNIFNVTNG